MEARGHCGSTNRKKKSLPTSYQLMLQYLAGHVHRGGKGRGEEGLWIMNNPSELPTTVMLQLLACFVKGGGGRGQ